MDKVNLFYKGNQYSIDLNSFSMYSDYFSSVDQEKYNDQLINLVDEFYPINFSKEVINSFISFFKNSEIEISTTNALCFKKLSSTFKISILQEKAEKFIESNYKDIIDYFLTTINSQKDTNIINGDYEKIISNHLIEYIDDDRLKVLPISSLCRIISMFSADSENDEEITRENKIFEEKLINLLINVHQAQQISINALFSVVQLRKHGIKYLIDKMKDKSLKKTIESILIGQPQILVEYVKFNEEEKKKDKKERKEIVDRLTKVEQQFNLLVANIESDKPMFIPSDESTIKEGQFRDLMIKEIEISSKVKKIENESFSGCKLLKNITIPSSVESIGSKTFNKCTSLTKISIPKSVKNIGDGIFNGCSSLKIIDLFSPITEIKLKSFNECSSLTKITIPNSVISIGVKAFRNCTSLTYIAIPS